MNENALIIYFMVYWEVFMRISSSSSYIYRNFRFGTIECSFFSLSHYRVRYCIIYIKYYARMVTCNIVPWELMTKFIYQNMYMVKSYWFHELRSLFLSRWKIVVIASENQFSCDKCQRLRHSLWHLRPADTTHTFAQFWLSWYFLY